ncbi:MAG TPA: hypothetical protein VHO03_19325 [Ignavibacteriales bacterium]|nr:hypothetical protein [Ignavibacteriales bacterium]
MKYAIFLLAVFLIAPGCSRREKPSLLKKTRTEESITRTIAQIDKINDTLSVFTGQLASIIERELENPKFQDGLQAKLDGFTRHLNHCKSEIKSLALVDKKCRTRISKLQDVISKGEEKISILQRKIAEMKPKTKEKEPQIARSF